ncbi:beta-ketoacyl-[acyl-carrier-protein] synthase family protein [Cohnella lubricantis]|uniref:Beta-ketoacyl-[acyl-carrier-protein] synthase family protein n=1 Tax=Cohnella lubricantis TaxID=2163172 RepID=A0A841TBA2_9BACL|nr:beta-ketoacyl-[acyl-carrier-protein] synthase family protein [Cohnella lubricantis]MBB6676297.1 beta-ketoacyl-[acyl-carrier-protein] synthase family protein [Cohnella lubricantis]MBP2119633.1 3-oxoacyl-[acyl-carrier-protein] synthase II [Cohnella lubricantis]
MAEQTRIVVTGMGAVTPYGAGVSSFWEGIISGRSAIIETPDEYLRQWAPATAPAVSFKPEQFMNPRLLQQTDRFTQLAIAAVAEALQDAGWADGAALHDSCASDRIGISVGNSLGGVQSLEEGSARLSSGKSSRVSARLVPKALPNAAAGTIAKLHDIHGPVMTYSAACASSANSIGEASYWLRLDQADVVLAGGTECLFSPSILSSLRSAGALADGEGDFAAWSRPFDKNRTGMVMGEGAAFLVLEKLEHARARGAKIYAELVGYGTSNDAYHETSPDPTGRSAKLAMERALRSAGLGVGDIDYINAHATATPAGDQAEANALRELFGEELNRIPVSSIKGSVGHMLGAAGAIESVACVKALGEGILPPTVNCDDKEDWAPADIVPNASRVQPVKRVLSNSFGFGGQNGVLIWQHADLLR